MLWYHLATPMLVRALVPRSVSAPTSTASAGAPVWKHACCLGNRGVKPRQHVVDASGECSRLCWMGFTPAISIPRLSRVGASCCHSAAWLLVNVMYNGYSRLHSPPAYR